MTDGQNSVTGLNNFDMSDHSAAGYAAKGRLGQATSNNSTLTSLLDDRTLIACTNAKAAGILVYTIAFGSGADVSQGLLKSCASNPKYFFAPPELQRPRAGVPADSSEHQQPEDRPVAGRARISQPAARACQGRDEPVSAIHAAASE